jgi:hypothetical protein
MARIMSPDAADHGSTIVEIATLVAGAGALLVIGNAMGKRWRETVGRRRDRYRRLARLGTGAHLSFFVSVLGEPPAMRSTVVKDDYQEFISPGDPDYDPTQTDGAARRRSVTRSFSVSTFIDRDYYVQTITDDDETVLAYSVTTRSKRFAPVFQVSPTPSLIERWRWRRRDGEACKPLVRVTLGRTVFADLDSTDPDQFAGPHFRIQMGAHNHAYSEFRYFGNPGLYQSFVWTASDAARQGKFGRGLAVRQEIDSDEWPDPRTPAPQPSWQHMPETQRFRQESQITTYTVVSQRLWVEENYPLERFGPHENDVRTVP